MPPFPASMEAFPTLRQSLLSTFDRCALSAKFDLDHREGWSTSRAASGHIFHRFAAKALRTMHETNERSIPTDLATEILLEALRQDDVDRVCMKITAEGRECGKPILRRYMKPPTQEEAERGVEYGLPRVVCEAGHDSRSEFVMLPFDQVKDLRWIVVKWANEMAFDIGNLVDIEHRLATIVRYPDPEGGFVERVLTGQLDALFVTDDDLEAIVLDWKDSWALPAPTEVGFDGYFQQRFYALLVLKTYPNIKRVTLREAYPRFGAFREATVYREDLDDIERELSALAERFDRTFQDAVFPPSPGAHCSFCPRPTKCPIFPNVRREGSIESEEDALRYAREITVADAVIKQRKDALAAWASVHGSVPVSSHKGPRVWGHKAIKRTARPKREEMERALEMFGPNVNLDDYYKPSVGSRFELHQPKPGDEDPETDDALMAALEASAEAVRKPD